MVALHKYDEARQRTLTRRRGRRPLTLVRYDSLPEDVEYRDTGCELSPSCLRCPLARCKYDVPFSIVRIRHSARDREIALLRRKYGAPIDAIASTYGISRRQVFRILKTTAIEGAAST
jgi:hypothetical protein